jgi:hypothetical protein
MRSDVSNKSRRPLLNDFGHRSGMVGNRRLLRGPSYLDRTGVEGSNRRDRSAGYCPVRFRLALCYFKTMRAATSLTRLL